MTEPAKAGTFAGLLADLEAFTKRALACHGGLADAGLEMEDLVRKHKVAYNYYVDLIPWADGKYRVWERNPDWVPGRDVPWGRAPVFEGTREECYAWMDRKVRGND